jgi:starch phosphorylase
MTETGGLSSGSSGTSNSHAAIASKARHIRSRSTSFGDAGLSQEHIAFLEEMQDSIAAAAAEDASRPAPEDEQPAEEPDDADAFPSVQETPRLHRRMSLRPMVLLMSAHTAVTRALTVEPALSPPGDETCVWSVTEQSEQLHDAIKCARSRYTQRLKRRGVFVSLYEDTLTREMTTAKVATARQPACPVAPMSRERLWELMSEYLTNDVDSIQRQIVSHIEFSLGRHRFNLTPASAYLATALATRDRLIEFWNDTDGNFTDRGVKRAYYLSIEFLMGRSLQNALINLELSDEFSAALRGLGFDLEELYGNERDAALGNGGLGRLAACFLDSMASLNLPCWGYGLRYKFGMFRQEIIDFQQREFPDYWLSQSNPWEIERLDVVYPVRFGGWTAVAASCPVAQSPCPADDQVPGTATMMPASSPLDRRHTWAGGQEVLAVAYDVPIPGFATFNTINLRLWSSRPSETFDLASFNRGDYYLAVKERQEVENITSVLYPDDSTEAGRELRLKQQYFFASATLQDILRRFCRSGRPWTELPDAAALQLNDTHPTVAIPELMRLLIDVHGLTWADAWRITTRTMSFTNHTVLPEALERWPVPLMTKLIPRIMQIVYDINFVFLQVVQSRYPGDADRMRRLSIIEEGEPKMVRMAHLAIVGSHAVNGVAELHTQILKQSTFADFYALWPGKFLNMTNGVTPRRWLLLANPYLSAIISEALGESDAWVTDLSLLAPLRQRAEDRRFQQVWMAAKQLNKQRLVSYLEDHCARVGQPGVISSNALFDVQIKRIHEYKRQLLNVLYVVHRYLEVRAAVAQYKQLAEAAAATPGADSPPLPLELMVPRVVVFAGKAAPAYQRAKHIIELILRVSKLMNTDVEVRPYLQCHFLPDYAVSLAELLIPASDISQHISTAGSEASGTSNMKFALNGGLILGTMDGANIEIAEEAGVENLFIFGAHTPEVNATRADYAAGKRDPVPASLEAVLAFIDKKLGAVMPSFGPIAAELRSGCDFYLLAHDWESYLEAQREVDVAYLDKPTWAKRSILTSVSCGKFSSDRTISQYAKQIWGIEPCVLPAPGLVASPAEQDKPSAAPARAG